MEKEEIQSVYNTLFQYWRDYDGASSKIQSKIEKSARMYADSLPDEIYLTLNQGSARGLFRSAFFQGDLERSLAILEEELER